MTEVDDAKAQTEQASQQAQQAREQLSKARADYQQQENAIRYPRKIPSFTPRQTREAQRVYLSSTLPQARKELDVYESDTLIPAERQIAQSKVNLSQYEQELADANQNIADYNLGRRLALENRYAGKLNYWQNQGYRAGAEERQNFASMVDYAQQKRDAIAQQRKAIEEFKVKFPDEKLTLDKNGNVVSIQSRAFGMSLSPQNYAKLLNRPTEAELALKMSLPNNLKYASTAELSQGMSLPNLAPLSQVKSVQPPVPVKQGLLGINLQELIYQQLRKLQKTKSTQAVMLTVPVVDENGNVVGKQNVLVKGQDRTAFENYLNRLKTSKGYLETFNGYSVDPQAARTERLANLLVYGGPALGLGAETFLAKQAVSYPIARSAAARAIRPLLAKYLIPTAIEPVTTRAVSKVRSMLPATRTTENLFNLGLGLATAISPTLGRSLGVGLAKDLVSNPAALALTTKQYVSEYGITPLLTFAAGNKALSIGKEFMYRKPREITIPGTKEKVRVIDLKSPDGKKFTVLLQESKYAASEKIEYREQLRAAELAKGNRFMVHVAPKILPTKKGELVVGIERGLYLAPESQIVIKGLPQAYTFYAELSRGTRRMGIANYLYKTIVKGEKINLAKDNARKEVVIVQQQSPGTPRWIAQGMQGIKNDVVMRNVRYWLKRWEIENPKTRLYKVRLNNGEIKELTPDKFIRSILKKKATPFQLAFAKAARQYSIETQSGLVGGIELQKGLAPTGYESQIVEPVGKKFIEQKSTRAKLYGLIGLQRGSDVVNVGGDLVEIAYFKPAKPLKQPRAIKEPIDEVTDLMMEREASPREVRQRPREENVRLRDRARVRAMNDFLVGRSRPQVQRTRPANERSRSAPRKQEDIARTRPSIERMLFAARPADRRERTRVVVRSPPASVRGPPIRTRAPPAEITDMLLPRQNKKAGKKFIKKPISKKRAYERRPTEGQQIFNLVSDVYVPTSQLTGFETTR